MDSTRSTTSMFPQSVVVGFVALAIVLLSLAIVGQIGILPFSSTSNSGAQLVPAVRPFSEANAEGLAMYFESERGSLALTPSTAAGMAAYHESEWTTAVKAERSQVGLAIYRASEWTAALEAPSLEAGLAAYRDSERSAFSNPGAISREHGLAIYRASERDSAGSEDGPTGWELYRASEQGR